MIIIMRPGADAAQIAEVEKTLEAFGLGIHRSDGEEQTILGAVGKATQDIDPRDLRILPGVQEVHRIMRPYKLVDRMCRPAGTVVDVSGVRIGGDQLTVMAGPCSVESQDQIMQTAASVKAAGAHMLRGGAFKPRSSPYSFQGLGEEGLHYLREAAHAHDMPCVTEVMDAHDLELVERYADMLQVGARNMQNYRLLTALGKSQRPVLLKRGLAATLEELLLSAEYIVAAGNPRVVLCERGVRTFEPWTRNTLDLSAIPVLRKLTHLPIVVDPSHATGLREYVTPMARAALAAGADGIMVEVHPDPDNATSDGAQSLHFIEFQELMADLRIIAPSVKRRLPAVQRKLHRRMGTPMYARAAILGVGLIGGSLGLALREVGAVEECIGLDRPEQLDEIRASGVVDRVFALEQAAEELPGCDLVFLAAPVGGILEQLQTIGPWLKKGALVSDVGSTKQAICQAAAGLGETACFVGGHPMAGLERSGAAFADPMLFQDAAWALCPVGKLPENQRERMRRLIEGLGAHPLWLESAQHDRLAAAVSHVPHLVAAALSNTVGRLGEEDPLAPRLAAGGFRDITRTASSPYALWRDILASNRESIADGLRWFRSTLDRIEAALDSEKVLESELGDAARYRLNIPRDLPGLHKPEHELIVRVIDEPGALAAVTTALAREQINVRDIQVLKVRQDEDGVLRLAFGNRKDSRAAAEVLRQAGHQVKSRG